MRQKLFFTLLLLYCCTLHNTCGHRHNDTASPRSPVLPGISSSTFKTILSHEDAHKI